MRSFLAEGLNEFWNCESRWHCLEHIEYKNDIPFTNAKYHHKSTLFFWYLAKNINNLFTSKFLQVNFQSGFLITTQFTYFSSVRGPDRVRSRAGLWFPAKNIYSYLNSQCTNVSFKFCSKGHYQLFIRLFSQMGSRFVGCASLAYCLCLLPTDSVVMAVGRFF